MVKSFPACTRLVPFILGYGAFNINIPIVKTNEYNLKPAAPCG